jgi:hypothetical protein
MELRISKISFYISSMYFYVRSYSTYLTKVNLSFTSPSFCFFSMGIFLPFKNLNFFIEDVERVNF